MAPKVVEFSVDTTTTVRSGEVWLTWSVIAAHSVRISELGKVPPSGKRSVTLTKPVRFQLEAWNDQGLVSAATDRVDVIELPTLDQHPLPIPTLSGVLTTPDLESVGPVPVIPPQLATRSAPLAVPIPALAFADDELRSDALRAWSATQSAMVGRLAHIEQASSVRRNGMVAGTHLTHPLVGGSERMFAGESPSSQQLALAPDSGMLGPFSARRGHMGSMSG